MTSASSRQVFLRDQQVELTTTEFKLLQVLAAEPGRMLSHRQLLHAVWGPSHWDEVAYLRVYMKQLRDKIEDDPSQPKRLVDHPRSRLSARA
jgi:two-component system, OmpR family, KDP operon response regulator KdpE